MTEKQPIYIMPENVSRTLGRDAQRNNILAAKVVADIVKTTLGPKGMDKMLVDSAGNIIVTNDGVTILDEMEIDHPAAKMIVDITKTQESEVGDGTTTVAMLAGKLLENAEKLLDKRIHPTVIVKGYKLAAEKSKEYLEEISFPVEDKEVLKNIAMTAMTGKGAEGNREKLSELIISAIDQVGSGKDVNIEDIKIQKLKGDSVEDSELIRGVIIDKEAANETMPKKVENAKIVLIDFPLELKSPETETKISVSTPEQLQSFIESEERILKEMTDKVINSGANVVFCQKGIDDVAQYYLAKAGIFACRRVAKSDMEKLARATSSKIISNLEGLTEENFGYAETVEEIKKGGDAMTYVKGCRNPKAVTILVRGSTEHVVDETERAIKDGLGDVVAAVKDGKVVAGGGAVEIELASRLRKFSRTLTGREQLAVEEFAQALESIPEALAENAGMDPINVLTELKQKHESGLVKYGLNLFNSGIEDCFAAGIIEPLKVKKQAISSASEVATMILRIDDVLISSGSSSGAAGGGGMPSQFAGMD
ncbi:MAG: TCP-1/cpn60 chaperonin family protein [Nanoarchaeota archaeon]|nr:TCP-1/cpn60 chaperonin family protein [Nanoarchaeota archaeon]